MADIRYYNDSGEIQAEEDSWFFINVGYGSVKGFQSRYGPRMYVPNTVAAGTESMASYLVDSIDRIQAKGNTPVVVFPIHAYTDEESDVERGRLASTMTSKIAMLNFAVQTGLTIFIETPADVHFVNSGADIHPGMVRNGSDGMVIEVGRDETGDAFTTNYLLNTGYISTGSFREFNTEKVSQKVLDDLVDTYEKEIAVLGSGKPSRGAFDKFFIIVFQYVGSAGDEGTLAVPDDVVMAKVIMRFNLVAIDKHRSFEAVFTTFKGGLKKNDVDKYKEKYKDRIKKVFERSVAIRDSSGEVSERESSAWNVLVSSFPYNSYNRVDLTFVDAEEEKRIGKKRVHPLGDLMSPRKYLKAVPEEYKQDVVTAVSYINNKNRDRTEKATVRSEAALSKFAKSMSMHDTVTVKEAEEAMKKLVGRYPIDKDHDFIFTDDPVSIFAKSTGQDWEEESCEKDGGSHNQGVYSDIEIGNCVVFIVENADDHPVARLMLRWCKDGDGKVGFGIEARWYYTTRPGHGTKSGSLEANKIYTGMTALKATGLVAKILKEKGLYDYEYCTTPYKYKGYSDMMRSSNTAIEYPNYVKSNRSIRKIVTGEDQAFDVNMSFTAMYDEFHDDRQLIGSLDDASLAAIYGRLVENSNEPRARGVITQVMAWFNDSRNYDGASGLVVGLATAGGRGFFDMWIGLQEMVSQRFTDNSENYSVLIDMLFDPVLATVPRAIVQLVSSISMLSPESICTAIPTAVAKLYNDSPSVLMSLLVLYSVGKNEGGFKYCVDRLCEMFKKERLMARLRAESEKIKSGGESYCSMHYGSIGGHYFCKRDAADKMFITRNHRDNYKVGICIIIDASSTYIPEGMYDRSAIVDSFSAPTAKKIIAAHEALKGALKEKGKEFLATFPASPGLGEDSA